MSAAKAVRHPLPGEYVQLLAWPSRCQVCGKPDMPDVVEIRDPLQKKDVVVRCCASHLRKGSR